MAVSDVEDPIALPSALSRLSELIDTRPQAFLLGDEEMHAASLEATKFVFDISLQQEQRARAPVVDLLRSINLSVRPQTRSQTRALADKPRAPTPPPRTDEEIWRSTPLDALHLEGMDDDQVWAQLELRTAALCDALKVILEEEIPSDEDGQVIDGEKDGLEVFDDLSGMEDMDDMVDMDDMDEEFYDSENSEEDEEQDEDGEDEDLGEGTASLRDPSDDEDLSDEEAMDLDRPLQTTSAVTKKGKQQARHPELDDGFFSLVDFNAEIEETEAKAVSKGRLGQDEDDEDDEDDADDADDDVDLFDTVDYVGAETFEEEDLEGEAYYKDFFEPPRKSLSKDKDKKGNAIAQEPENKPKKSQVRFHEEVKVKNIRSRGKGISLKDALMQQVAYDEDDDDEYEDEDDEFGEEQRKVQIGESEDDDDDDDDAEMKELADETDEYDEDGDDGRETIERLKDDLFAEDEYDKPSKDISTYEARQAEIAAQIAELEAKNVGPKEWTVMGEANSRSRPINSLLEEDLEFDRVMKPTPVVTEEAVSSLEDMIKRRILDNRFDDVVRRRAVDDKPFLPSRLFELNDQKSAKSLAEIYENEYSAAARGTSMDDRDGKLKQDHEAIEKIWDNICYKLDALSNAHFTPKAPKATITTVSNLPVGHLESALPTTQSTTTMMAPEEIFAPEADIRAREELTPSEKKARRTKQRKARKKASDQLAATVDKFTKSQKARGSASVIRREKEKALKGVVKSGKGVTVVGKQRAELKGKSRQSAAVDSKSLKL